MRKVILSTVVALVLYWTMAWATVMLLGITGINRWILGIILMLLGLVAAAVIVWFLHRQQKQQQASAEAAGPLPAGGEEIDEMPREEKREEFSAECQKCAR